MDNNLELYRIFHTVAVCGNISAASERLFISQPAVSKTIKKLEEVTGTVLFSRNSRGVKLTEEGKVFFQYIEKAMNEITVGEKVLDRLRRREQGNIKLGVSTTLCKHFLIPKLRNFIKEYPDIEIKISNNTSSMNIALVEKGEVDLCISSEPLVKDDFYDFIKLSEIQDTFVAGKGYFYNIDKNDNIEMVSSETLMLLEPDNIARKYADGYFASRYMSVKPEIEISNMDLLVEFAKIGMGATIVIKDFIKSELEEGSLVEIPMTPAIPKRNIGVIYHRDIPLSLAAQTFLEYLL
ncbi:MAG: LysR family transcriptional regulator [Bacillota bacterium]|nr:LysR family transcriptional regulator [Bacillota bacterium]